MEAAKVEHFVLHSLRHTFLTRLGEAGVDAWALARIAGHSSIKMSMGYVHTSATNMSEAIARLGGHNSGHTGSKQLSEGYQRLATTSVL